MLKPLPRTLHVEVDTREKFPLLFPHFILTRWSGRPCRIQIETVRIGLKAGDYRLAEYPDLLIVERKGSASELVTNLLTRDYRRQAKALASLISSCDHPYILLEESCATLKSESGELLQALGRILGANPRISLLMVGPIRDLAARRRVGEFLIHLVLGHVLQHQLSQELPQVMEG